MESSASNTLIQLSELLGTSAENVTAELVLILTGLATVGLLSMAIVNIVKLLAQPRKLFYRYHILTHIIETVEKLSLSETPHDYARDVEKYIARVATGGEHSLLYALDIEQLLSQIKTVTNILMASLTSETSADRDEIRDSIIEENLMKVIRAWTRNLHKDDWNRFISLNIYDDDGKIIKAKKLEYENLRTYIVSLIDGNLNSILIRVNYRWKLCQQSAAMLVSFALILNFGEISAGWLLIAVAGGVLAPFSHDLVSFLSKASKRA